MHGGTGVARVRVVMISKPHIQIVTHKSETELLFVHLRSFNHPPTILRFALCSNGQETVNTVMRQSWFLPKIIEYSSKAENAKEQGGSTSQLEIDAQAAQVKRVSAPHAAFPSVCERERTVSGSLLENIVKCHKFHQHHKHLFRRR